MPTIPNTDWMDIDYGDMYDVSDFAGERDSRSTDELAPIEDAPVCVHCGVVGPFPYEWPVCADCEDRMQSAWEEKMSELDAESDRIMRQAEIESDRFAHDFDGGYNE